MKKTILKFVTATALLTSGLINATASEISKLDVKKECNVEVNGVEKVLATATKYNEIAIKNKVEFMRLGMKASQYIEAVDAALKSGAKNIDIIKSGNITRLKREDDKNHEFIYFHDFFS